MKNTIKLLLGIFTILTFNVTYSQEKELEIRFLHKSDKGKIRLDSLTDDSYTDIQDVSDKYFFESIVFHNWSNFHGLKVTKKNYSDDTDELVFFSKSIQGDYVKKKKTGEYVFTLNLVKYGLSCCGDIIYQIIDSESQEVIKEFKVGQDIDGE